MRAPLVVVVSAFPAVLSLDTPGFVQQYAQRIGGHASELRTFLRDFDQDANRWGLDREGAIQLMRSKPEEFFRARAARVTDYEVRLKRLEQQEELARQTMTPFTLLAFYRSYDEAIYEEARKAHKWSVNVEGIQLALLVWSLVASVLGAAALLLGVAFRRAR